MDAFHEFLVSLPAGPNGHYWALVGSLLSVQCRDVVALQVVKNLMREFPSGMEDISRMEESDLLPFVRSCNFCNTKAKNIITATTQIQTLFQGQVPCEYKSLLKLHGVGPKIAHLLRSVSFGIDDTGIVVDTHVHQVARALGWTSKTAKLPEETSVVAFTGKPDPDDVIGGKWPIKRSQFYKKIYKQLKTPKWVQENWT